MALRQRSELKRYFAKGQTPSESNFIDLIDSTVNLLDDSVIRIIKNDKANAAAILTPNPQAATPARQGANNSGNGGANASEALAGPTTDNLAVQSKVAQSTQGLPNGVQTFEVPANGKWTPILTQLNGIRAYNIVAAANNNVGKAALLHATALSIYGLKKSTITETSLSYGGLWNKIKLRWTGDRHNFSLEIRTTVNYGDNVNIKVFITTLLPNDD